MSRTLVISDPLYKWLENAARQQRFNSVEELLEAWKAADTDLKRREDVVNQIDMLRHKLFAQYGEMPDSVDSVREDRQR